jgi:AcrR family transcriptional regulator
MRIVHLTQFVRTNKSTSMATQPLPALALRLVEAAIDQFGRAGFEGASTRDIAAASGTTMSSITYHFGGKQGLYLACADYIADRIGATHERGMAVIRANPPRTADEARMALLMLLDNFAGLMLAPESEAWSQFIVREQQRPTEAFERIYARVMGPVLATAIDLLVLVRPSLDESARRVLVLNFVGMTLVLRLARACVARVMGVADIDQPTAQTLVAGLRRTALDLLKEEQSS